jgi:hypothetical protein
MSNALDAFGAWTLVVAAPIAALRGLAGVSRPSDLKPLVVPVEPDRHGIAKVCRWRDGVAVRGGVTCRDRER